MQSLLESFNNFNSYLAILSAIESSPISRLDWPDKILKVGWEGGIEGGREGGRKGGREEGREGGRAGGLCSDCCVVFVGTGGASTVD